MRDGQEHVIASIADYFIVRELLEGSLIETVKGTSRKTEILVKEVVAIQREKEKNAGNEDIDIHCDVKTSEVLERTRSSRSSVYKWLQPAIEAGLIEKNPGGKRGHYRATEKAMGGHVGATNSFLPDPGKILNAFPELARGVRFTHPLTGEVVEVRDDEDREQ